MESPGPLPGRIPYVLNPQDPYPWVATPTPWVANFQHVLYVVIPHEAVEIAMRIVRKELTATGLNVNEDKSRYRAPSGACPPGPVGRVFFLGAGSPVVPGPRLV